MEKKWSLIFEVEIKMEMCLSGVRIKVSIIFLKRKFLRMG